MNERDIKSAVRSCPKIIGATSGALTLLALLCVVHRIYFAHLSGIALWKGTMAGSFIGFIVFMGTMRIYRREKWFYWLLLAVGIVVFGISTIHGLAEIIRVVSGESVDFVALTMTIGFAVLSFVVVSNLLRRESREYFDGK